MPGYLKRPLYFCGAILAFAGVLIVLLKLRNQVDQLPSIGATAGLTLTVLAIAYGMSNFLLAFAWREILSYYQVDVCFPWAAKLTGVYQITKYVPGNVMHIAGRQALGLAAGLPGWPFAKSAVFELGLLASAGSLFSVLLCPVFFSGLNGAIPLVVFIAVLFVAFFGALLWIGAHIARAFLSYVCFLCVSAMLFLLVVWSLNGVMNFTFYNIVLTIGSYVVAWLLGMATPGAPAGIGIRELVLVFFLKSVIHESDLLMAVVLSRLTTVAGDLIFFGVTFLAFRNSPVANCSAD